MADSGIDCLKTDFLKLSSLTSLARPAGVEPATLGLEGLDQEDKTEND